MTLDEGMEMGQKIKDSLLRKYAQGETITKNVVYHYSVTFCWNTDLRGFHGLRGLVLDSATSA